MFNIKELSSPEIVRTLYRLYYLQPIINENEISSHWKEFSQKIQVYIDDNEDLLSFRGYGFGDLHPTNPLNKILKCLCNLSYFVRLPYKKDLLFLVNKSLPILKKINSYLSYDCFRQICSLCTIRKYLKLGDQEKFDILVIGDGYGFLSALVKSVYPNSKVTLIDIGKVLFFQVVNLQRIYPKHSHHLLCDSGDSEEYDFLYVPAENIEKIKNIKYRLIINISSMQEMNYETINSYFTFMRLNSTTDNLFYCCNRKQKILPGGEVIEFLRYPWRKEDRHLVDETCFFYKYHFSIISPFIHRFDGLIMHRLTNLRTEFKG